jgi:vancomycin resistance protein VanJ
MSMGAVAQGVSAPLRVVLQVLTVLYLAALALGLGVMLLGSSHQGWPALLRELFPLLFVPAPFLLASVLLVRSRGAILALVAVMALFAACSGPRIVVAGTPAVPGPKLRIFSLNVGASRHAERPDAVVRAVLSTNPDVVCLVEAPRRVQTVVDEQLGHSYPFLATSEEIMVLSRLPIGDPERGFLSTGAHDSLQVTLGLDNLLVDVTVVHLLRADEYPGFGGDARPVLGAVRRFSTDDRDRAVDGLLTRFRASRWASILAGDFNMTPTSGAYGALSRELKDAFAEVGQGFGHTYPSSLHPFGVGVTLPVIRIDYVWHSDDFVAADASVGPDSGSDHLPVVTDLVLRTATPR